MKYLIILFIFCSEVCAQTDEYYLRNGFSRSKMYVQKAEEQRLSSIARPYSIVDDLPAGNYTFQVNNSRPFTIESDGLGNTRLINPPDWVPPVVSEEEKAYYKAAREQREEEAKQKYYNKLVERNANLQLLAQRDLLRYQRDQIEIARRNLWNPPEPIYVPVPVYNYGYGYSNFGLYAPRVRYFRNW